MLESKNHEGRTRRKRLKVVFRVRKMVLARKKIKFVTRKTIKKPMLLKVT
jgi:hypothetical protein